MHRTILVGSPRIDGRSAALAEQIFDACIDECPDDGVSMVSIASIEVAGCIGCDVCKPARNQDDPAVPAFPDADDPLAPQSCVRTSDAWCHVCVFVDDMQEVRKHLDAADELIMVSPVYFASVPAQMKALLDRMQPYFWSNVRQQRTKRSLTLHVVGEGGDPHGIEPLIGTVRSAFAVAGFQIDKVLDWRGNIDATGEIQKDATVYGA